MNDDSSRASRAGDDSGMRPGGSTRRLAGRAFPVYTLITLMTLAAACLPATSAQAQPASTATRGKAAIYKSFDDAFLAGYRQFAQLNKLKGELGQAAGDERKAKQVEYRDQLVATRDALRVALAMATPDASATLQAPLDFARARKLAQQAELGERLSDKDQEYFAAYSELKKFQQARYLLAYVNTQLGDYYEAGILGEYVARNWDPQDSMSLDSAFFALAAYVRAYKEAEGDNQSEVQMLIDVATLIDRRWPESIRADEARMTVARLYHQQQPRAAAEWYDKISQQSPQYAEAQLAAGQSFWSVYLNALQLPAAQRPPAAQLDALKQTAETRLRNGIDRMHAELADQAQRAEEQGMDLQITATDSLAAGKVSLAQLKIFEGEYETAIQLLTEEPVPVTEAVAIEDETQRPATGRKSRPFALQTYQLLLRAYVGRNELDKARETMSTLEHIAGESNTAALTALYVQIGRKLETELSAVRDDPQKVQQLQDSFEAFLATIAERQEGLTFGTALWVAETFAAFAQKAETEDLKQRYSERTIDAYRGIIERAAEDPEFMPASNVHNIRMRLARAQRAQGDFEGALESVAAILEDKPKALDAQVEANQILQAQGLAERSLARLREAIQGLKLDDGVTVWGWGQTASILQRTLESGSTNPQFEESLFEARAQLAECRMQIAQLAGDDATRTRELQLALSELSAVLAVYRDTMPDLWWDRFGALYLQIQEMLGQNPDPIER